MGKRTKGKQGKTCKPKKIKKPKYEPIKINTLEPQEVIPAVLGSGTNSWKKVFGRRPMTHPPNVSSIETFLNTKLSHKRRIKFNTLAWEHEDYRKRKVKTITRTYEDHYRVVSPKKPTIEGRRGTNVRELFHGTAPVNGTGILMEGFRAGTYGMFGGGIYFGYRGKASNFASSAVNQKGNTQVSSKVLLKCWVALGKIFKATEAMHGLRSAPAGYNSVEGVVGVTASWGGRLQASEWVVYDPQQVSVVDVIIIHEHTHTVVVP